MDEFKEYARFPDLEKATEFTSFLEEYKIPYQLDDNQKRAAIVPLVYYDPWSNQYILKLKESDFEKVNIAVDALNIGENKGVPEHYLYTFADKDILDIIANQNEWTKEEVQLALKIAHDRKIELTAQSINNAKKAPATETSIKSSISTTSSFFWIIGIFTIANSVFIRKDIEFHLPGLAFAEILDRAFARAYGEYGNAGLISCLLISGVFFLLARFGKRNKWVFLGGLIIYFLDSLLVYLSPQWGQLIFIFIALWTMITGLVNTFKEDRLPVSNGDPSN